MSEIIDAIVQVDVRALLRDHPNGWYDGSSTPVEFDKYYDVFVPRKFSDTRKDGKPRIICNQGDVIVFRPVARAGTGRYILIDQFDVKTSNSLAPTSAFDRFISTPRFLTGSGDGRNYGPAAARIVAWNGWDIIEWTTLAGPDRTEHFMEITALRDTLGQNTAPFEGDMAFTVGFTLRNDGGVWVKYQYDPYLQIRQKGTPYKGEDLVDKHPDHKYLERTKSLR